MKTKRKSRTVSGYRTILSSLLNPKFGKRAGDKVSSKEIAQLHLWHRDTPCKPNRLLAILPACTVLLFGAVS
jgi:hypothetical protein